MISVSLGLAGGIAVVAVVVVSDWSVVEVVVGRVMDGEVVDEAVVVAPAAGEVEEAAGVGGGAGKLVVTTGASVPVSPATTLAGPACSTGTTDALSVFPERSAEADDEPHAAAPITTHSTSTAICSLFTRLTLWLHQRISPLPRKGPVW